MYLIRERDWEQGAGGQWERERIPSRPLAECGAPTWGSIPGS